MKAPALIAVVTSALLTVVSCSRAETPTEPSTTGFLRVTTVLEGQCPPALAIPPHSVYVDGVQVGTVPVPGASSFVLAVGSHSVHVGTAPSANGFPVYTRYRARSRIQVRLLGLPAAREALGATVAVPREQRAPC